MIPSSTETGQVQGNTVAKEENVIPDDLRTDEDYISWISENSEDTKELSDAYSVAKDIASHEQTLKPWRRELLGRKISPDSFNRFGDRNHVTGGLARAWLKKDGEEIDTLAQELSTFGGEVTEQDVIDFMLDNPSNRVSQISEDMRNLSKRFSEVASKEVGFSVGGPESNTGRLYTRLKEAGQKLDRLTEQQKNEAQTAVDADMGLELETSNNDLIQQYQDEVADDYVEGYDIAMDDLGNETADETVIQHIEEKQPELYHGGFTAEELDDIYSKLENNSIDYGRDGQTENSGEDKSETLTEAFKRSENGRSEESASDTDSESRRENRSTEEITPFFSQEDKDITSQELKNSGNVLNVNENSISLPNGNQIVDENDEVSESIPQGKHGAEASEDGRIEEALSECRRRSSQDERYAQANSGTLSRRDQKEIENKVLEEYAKEKGIWIPMQDVFSLGIPAPSGNENDVYLDVKDGSVYKVNNLMNSGNITSLLERIKLHNEYFPDTKYKLAGFSGFGRGDVFPVLKQDYVENTTEASPEEIGGYMQSLGFHQTAEASYSNGDVTISDLCPRNVLKDADGDIYVIDADFQKEEPTSINKMTDTDENQNDLQSNIIPLQDDGASSDNKQDAHAFISPTINSGEDVLDYAQRIAHEKEEYDTRIPLEVLPNAQNEEVIPKSEISAQEEAVHIEKGDKVIEDAQQTLNNIAEERGKVNQAPTEAQKEAGNYKKGHVKIGGYSISIESPKGSERSGVDTNGQSWSVTMNNDYGYIRGTESVDGDHIDMFLSDFPDQGNVFVVDQVKEDGSFDEHKVMYGFSSVDEAKEAYLANYSPGWKGLGIITEVSKEGFKKWIDSSKRKTKPFAEYTIAKVKEDTETGDNTNFPISHVGNSGMIVNEDGTPMTLYHGTTNKGVNAVTELEPGHKRDDGDKASFNGSGVSFTPNESVALDYSLGNSEKIFKGNVVLKNPYYSYGVLGLNENEAEAYSEKIKSEGYDGIIVYASPVMRSIGDSPIEVVVFSKDGIVDYYNGSEVNKVVPGREILDTVEDEHHKNTKNNQKLNDLITRDDKGDVIPLSKRFNSRKHEPRFREMDDVGEPVLRWNSISEELNDEDADSYEAENYGRLTINNVNQEIYDISGPHLSKLYKNGSLGRVLVGDHADINQIKAYREYNSARENLDPLRKKLGDMIPRCTNAARKEVENTISDIDYALDYYKRLYEGEDVWRSAAIPRFRILDEQSNTPTEEDGEVAAKIGELVESLHTPVRIARTIADVSDGAAKRAIEKGRNIKGWYDPNTGEVVVYLPNTVSAADAQATILHEAVAHKGLKEMLGEESFNELCGKVFDTLPEDVRNGLLEKHKDRLIAGDEYMASIAENGCDATLWQKIKGFIRDAFRKIGVDLSVIDNDIKYLLWKSKNRLMKGDNGMNMVQKIAADADMRENLGIGEYKRMKSEGTPQQGDSQDTKDFGKEEGAESRSGESGQEPGVVRFRDETDNKSSDGTIEQYEAELNKQTFKAKEAYQDSMLALKKMQDIIAQKSDKGLKSFEDAYTAENHLSSKNTAEVESYGKHFFRPIMEEIGNLINNGNSYDDVKRYVFAKHGLERNEVFAQRDARNAVIEKFWKKKNDVQYKYDNGKLSKDEYEEELQELQLTEKDFYEQEYKENRQRDYSGLTTLTEDKENYEELAQEIIDEFERSNDVSGLWQAINSATKETLKKTYESGLVDKATYEKVSNQFRYYIPLRGWNEETATDVYEYLQSEVSPVNATMKTAKGRMSLADDPFATIGNMAESNIFMGNRNLMKQRFMNMVLNHSSDAVSLNEAWYVRDSSTGDWVLSSPDINPHCRPSPQDR